MSVETLAVCLHHSRAAGTDKLVLLGIANHDGDGGAWPSLATLAKYANVRDASTVRRSLQRLEALGEIRRLIGQGGGEDTPNHMRPNLYRVLLRCPVTCDRSPSHRVSDPRADSHPRADRPLGVIPHPGSRPHGAPRAISHAEPSL